MASAAASMRVYAAQTAQATNSSSSVSECMSGCGDPSSDSYSSCLNSCLGIEASPLPTSMEQDTDTVPTTKISNPQNTPKDLSKFALCRGECQSKGIGIPVCFVQCMVQGPSIGSEKTFVSSSTIIKKSWTEMLKDRIMFWKKPAILSGKACAIGENNGNCKRCEDKKSYFDQITEAWYCGEKPAANTLFGIQPILPVITLPPLKIPTLAMPTLKVPTLSVPRVSPEASPSGE